MDAVGHYEQSTEEKLQGSESRIGCDEQGRGWARREDGRPEVLEKTGHRGLRCLPAVHWSVDVLLLARMGTLYYISTLLVRATALQLSSSERLMLDSGNLTSL